MTATLWTLKINGAAVYDLRDTRFANVTLAFRSLAADTLAFVHGSAFDAAPLMAVNDVVEVFRNNVRVFKGQANSPQPLASAGAEGIRYSARGAWAQLEETAYLQQSAFSGGLNTIVVTDTPEVTLFALGGAYASAGAMITHAINAAIGAGRDLALGTVDLDIQPRAEAAQDLSCAAVIVRAARWQRGVSWFDYTVDPPALSVVKHSTPAAAALAIGTDVLPAIEITANESNRVAGVALYFRTPSEDGITTLAEQRYPVDTDPQSARTLVASVALDGGSASYLEQDITMKPFQHQDAAEGTRKAFWADIMNLAAFIEQQADGGAITSWTVGVGSEIWPNGPEEEGDRPTKFLYAGAFAEWMGIAYYEVQLSATLTLTRANGQKESFDLVATVQAANATTQTYRSLDLDSYSPAESAPAGLAAALFNAFSETQYAGSVTLAARDCGATLDGAGQPLNWLARRLNLTGGPAAWSTMAATVAEVVWTLPGRTTLSLGAPQHLTLNEVRDLLSQNRQRRSPRFARQEAGTDDVSQQLPSVTAARQNMSSSPQHEVLVVAGQSNKVTLDATNGRVRIHAGANLVIEANKDGQIVVTAGNNQSITLDVADLAANAVVKFRDITYVTNVAYDTATGILKQTKITARVLGAAIPAGSDSTVETAEAC
jgi:hypothetical protein